MLVTENQRRLNQVTRDFIRKQTGLDISESEAEEIRSSLVQYSRVLLEIHKSLEEEVRHE